jgi:hypothetical protein
MSEERTFNGRRAGRNRNPLRLIPIRLKPASLRSSDLVRATSQTNQHFAHLSELGWDCKTHRFVIVRSLRGFAWTNRASIARAAA